MKSRLLTISIAGLIACGWAVAQPDSPNEFEVASVKLSPPDTRITMTRILPGGRVLLSGVTLRDMLMSAWGVQSFQILGGPSWMDATKFDVSAKAESRPRPEELRLMYQALLRDRFQLAVHREARQLPIYSLVLSRKDGSLGPGLVKRDEGGCQPGAAAKPAAKTDVKSPGCGGMRTSAHQIIAESTPITSLAPALARILGTTVTDLSGLAGYFDINLQWTQDETQPPPTGDGVPEASLDAPSLFTALKEQLGLKLEKGRGPVETIVVDHVEKPSDN